MPKNTAKSNPMTQDELQALQGEVESVSQVDVQVGRVLDAIVSHLARLNNLDYPVVIQEETPAEPVEQVDTPVEQVDFPAQEGQVHAN